MMRVAYQGEAGAYSERAAGILFGKSIRANPKSHFHQVFEAVHSKACDKGVIPIENSLAGSIHENFDLLRAHELAIIGECYLRIEHVLMAPRGVRLRDLRAVHSHPQALSQCSRFFLKHPHIEPVADYDTAGSAKWLAATHKERTGAIAGKQAAALYGLHILRRNLENNHWNFTRFLGVARRGSKPLKGSRLKTSILFVPARNRCGILFKMLGVFALRDINLLKIESRPLEGRAFEYVFYLDLEGHPGEAPVRGALDQLGEMSSEFRQFGAYPPGRYYGGLKRPGRGGGRQEEGVPVGG